ncbi:type II toxin-antitoxin system RelE/ParE family toxin [Mesorhizobium sp. B4-1-1]|uniref:type II toxin-antitoxin system RelE/ParE family toxin n=1 Tax=Mesorhizobium sp. B4-1-1 TaxID=2589890 RepID=UPI0032B2A12C
MVVRIVWSPTAKADLIDIYITIGAENLKAADHYYEWIEDRAAQLVDQPRMGVRRPDIRPSARMLVAAPFLPFTKRSQIRTAVRSIWWRSYALSTVAGI